MRSRHEADVKMTMNRKQSGKSTRPVFGKRGRKQVEQAERTPTLMARLRKTAGRWLRKLRQARTTKPTKPNRSWAARGGVIRP
jgi:hypothetical protein